MELTASSTVYNIRKLFILVQHCLESSIYAFKAVLVRFSSRSQSIQLYDCDSVQIYE